MKDVLGHAIADYYHRRGNARLWVHHAFGPKDEMPVEVYFRDMNDMPELEWIALQHCRGKILDIGAGAGSHSLALSRMGLDCTALEISSLAAAVMKERGIKKVRCQDFFTLRSGRYDTLLLLMNGIGLAGTLNGLRAFFVRTQKLLRPGGRLIFDSSDVAYLYKGRPPRSPYYGEVIYQYEYRRQKSEPFSWLFVDIKTLQAIAREMGWEIEVLYRDARDQYLVACRPST